MTDTTSTLYLDAKHLLPGDVLLTDSKGWGTLAVRLDNGRGFSHAILAGSTLCWYEADFAGIGPTYVEVAKCEPTSQSEAWFVDISAYKRFAVFRHVAVVDDPSTAKALGLALEQFISAYDGLTYPKLTRLAAASRFAQRTPSLARKLLHLIDLLVFRRRKRILSGVSCSELVALFYENAGLPLFEPLRESATVTPNDLATSSALREVTSILRASDPNIPNDDQGVRKLNESVRIAGKGRGFARRWTDFNQAWEGLRPMVEECEARRGKTEETEHCPTSGST